VFLVADFSGVHFECVILRKGTIFKLWSLGIKVCCKIVLQGERVSAGYSLPYDEDNSALAAFRGIPVHITHTSVPPANTSFCCVYMLLCGARPCAKHWGDKEDIDPSARHSHFEEGAAQTYRITSSQLDHCHNERV
jgi:hypothetical protein